eukprot:3752955-Rhodomonas_salina.3
MEVPHNPCQSSRLNLSVLTRIHTCCRQDLDPALLRRFERKIKVGLQDEQDRAQLLSFLMSPSRGTLVDESVDFGSIARETEGYSGADIELLCREAAMYGEAIPQPLSG